MKNYHSINKLSTPDNIVAKTQKIKLKSKELQRELPIYLHDYFIFLSQSVAVSTELEYTRDIHFFFRYLINETTLTQALDIKDIRLEELNELKARDINRYLGDYMRFYTKKTSETEVEVVENHNSSLARKKSALSTMFKFLFREEMLSEDITRGFNPIKLKKKQAGSIIRLESDEVAFLIEALMNGEGLTDKEKQYWNKTKLRDLAIIVILVTYGLRKSEIQQLNLSSINFRQGYFKIYRKRGKESKMPLNKTAEIVLNNYIEQERPNLLKEQEEDALWISLQGKRVSANTINHITKKYTSIVLEGDRNSGYSPHKLRATAASMLIEQGFSIYDVQEILDHDMVTTTQLYSAHPKNAKRNVLKQFELIDE